MIYTEHHKQEFKTKVSKALDSVRRVLDVDRSSKLRMADDVDHEYKDKYKLANLMTNIAIVALVSVLEQLGVTKEILRSIDKSKETTLRFSTTESCTFAKEEVVDEPLPLQKKTQEKSTVTTEFGTSESTTQKSTIETIVKRVLKQHYTIEKDWELSIYSGTDVENRKIIQERKGASCEYVRSLRPDRSKRPTPFPRNKEYPHIELSLTWLLQQIDAQELKSHFTIDTSPDNDSTKTPRRNPQMDQALSFFNLVRRWVCGVESHFYGVQRRFSKEGVDFETLKCCADQIFVPVIPLLVDQTSTGEQIQCKSKSKDREEEEGWEEDEPSSMGIEVDSKAIVSLPPVDAFNDSEAVTLSNSDTTCFLNEHAKSLSGILREIREDSGDIECLPDLISPLEFNMEVICIHTQRLVQELSNCIRYVEGMLRLQLVAAIGKEVGKFDLDKFVRYHNEKLFSPRPERFCYTIRRPEHYPDGILGIEEEVFHDGKSVVESISTHVREVPSADPIKVPLNAATTVSLTGNTYLHGWLNHRFGDNASDASIRLNARARQFSSFILLIGTMTNQNHLQPKDAIILRNKDEVHIPLLLNEIPTATEFKDAIGSLSPEQQRFAKSFRSMQLDSSVLGVCVIQIKPQLERLLGLPKDSLTKEMKLMEDLTELFIEYQVPSDLVSCDFGAVPDNDEEGKISLNSVKEQVANVREHVKSVMDVIATQKQEQLEEQKLLKEMAKMQAKTDRAIEAQEMAGCRIGTAACAPPRPSGAPPSLGAVARSSTPSGLSMACYRMADLSVAPMDNVKSAAPMTANSYMFESAKPEWYQKKLNPDQSKSSVQAGSKRPSVAGSNTGNLPVAPLEKENVIFAAMPKVLDRAIELHDKNAALRSTTIKTANKDWTQIRQESLLSKPKTKSLGEKAIASEKSRAFDLLDALSRSGSLDIPFSDLHVLICATHSFEKNVMDTVIVDNVNPIEKLEMSTLLMASTILGVPSRDLIRGDEDRKRLETSFPLLLSNGSDEQSNAENDAETAGDDALVATDC